MKVWGDFDLKLNREEEKDLRKRGRVKVNGKLKASIKAAIVIISVITILSIINHQFHEVSIGGVFKLEE